MSNKELRLTCGKREKIRFSMAWMSAHLLRADKGANHTISAAHDRLFLKYLREAAEVAGFNLEKRATK